MGSLTDRHYCLLLIFLDTVNHTGFPCFDLRLTSTSCKKVRQVIHCLIRLALQLITLKCIPSQSDHLGMMINESVKRSSRSTSHWASAVMWVMAVTLGRYCDHGYTSWNRGSCELILCLIFFALVSPVLFEKPAAVQRKCFLHTSKYRCKVERTSGAPCGHARRRVR